MDNRVLRIDVASVVRERLPGASRFVPGFLLDGLARLIHQEELNALLESNAGREGADFCRGVLADLGVTYNIIGGENMPAAADRRVVYVSNHPLGALDGIALIDMVTRHHGVEPRFVVNDLLMAVKPLRRVFVPINKHGGQTHAATSELQRAFEADAPVIVFPAGLVSRKRKGGEIHDLEWRKMVVNKAVEHGRDIIPLYFGGCNSPFFYNFAKLRTLTGLKFNVEMALLPGEIFKCRGACFPIVAGRRVKASTLAGGREARREVQALCDAVYSLRASLPDDK
ncbi:MAG: glycerol acyltransferase [Bacteroidales bacterium]|nr:glycerol acyltransferase [Bacteroidales bacterium]